MDAYRVVAGFITYRDAPGGPVAYLNNLANSVYLFKSTLYVIQTLVGDSYMVRSMQDAYDVRLKFVWMDTDISMLCYLAEENMDRGISLSSRVGMRR